MTTKPLVADNDNHHDFYVYAWLRPDGTPFYIGKGRGNRAQKFKRHNEIFTRIVSKISADGSCPRVVKWVEGIGEIDAFRLECSYIALFGRRNNNTGVLANLTDGGEGASGYRHTNATKRKIGIASTKWERTQEIRDKIGSSRKGVPLSDEHKLKLASWVRGPEMRAKISAATTGRKLSEAHLEKMRGRSLPSVVIAKIVAKNTGKKRSPEARARMSAAQIGKTMPSEFIDYNKSRVRHEPPSAANRSGFKGVCYCGQTEKWRAAINIEGRYKSLGRFTSKTDAARAYDAAAYAAWGDDCYLNFPRLEHGG